MSKIIGIDLGTTNSAVAYVDLKVDQREDEDDQTQQGDGHEASRASSTESSTAARRLRPPRRLLTPLRLPREGTDVFAQSTEQGCLAIVSQVISFFAIHHVDDKGRLFREVFDRLSPGRGLVFADITVAADPHLESSFLDGWIDFDNSGTWDAGEQVFIDTALAYGDGHSERLVGRIVRESERRIYVATKVPPKNQLWPARSGIDIDQVFPGDYVVRCTEQSLRNLGLEVVDLQGRLVAVLFDEARPGGDGTAVWNGRDDAGRQVARGTYFYRLVAGDFAETKSSR